MSPNLIGASQLIISEASKSPQSDGDSKKQGLYVPQASKPSSQPEEVSQKKYKWDIVWINVIGIIYLHVAGVYGVYLAFFKASWATFLWACFLTFCGAMGHTAGSHRLWTHRAYKAKLPLRLLLALFQTIMFENHIYEWVRDHRVHHKFTDTDADPHNSTRGFFFSHVGWLMVRKHKDVIEKGKTVDLSDLEQDPVVVYQRKFYLILMPLFTFVMPTLVPWYFWQENLQMAWMVAGIGRYFLSVSASWLVNSAAHLYGMKPYDKNIAPRENTLVGYLSLGEGWHNYHHVFSWDYKAAELGNYYNNPTTAFIDFFAKIGWAYDLKTVSEDMIRKRISRTGDGSKKVAGNYTEKDAVNGDNIWGWGDKDMSKDEVGSIRMFNKLADK